MPLPRALIVGTGEYTTLPFAEWVRRMYDTLKREDKLDGLAPDPEYDRIVATWRRWSERLLQEFSSES